MACKTFRVKGVVRFVKIYIESQSYRWTEKERMRQRASSYQLVHFSVATIISSGRGQSQEPGATRVVGIQALGLDSTIFPDHQQGVGPEVAHPGKQYSDEMLAFRKWLYALRHTLVPKNQCFIYIGMLRKALVHIQATQNLLSRFSVGTKIF